MLMAKMLLFTTTSCMIALRSMQTSTSGGSSDSEQNALAVMPRSSSSWREVTTVTPLAQLDSVPRNRSGSTGTGPLLTQGKSTPTDGRGLEGSLPDAPEQGNDV